MAAEEDLVQVELTRIIIFETSSEQMIFLKEMDGERTFPILIGIYEAAAIDRKVKKLSTPRPLTHDLLGTTITSLGGHLERVVVNDLRDNTFYAKLVIRQNGQIVEIDSRPSDAIALAVQADAPIYVASHVIGTLCGEGKQPEQDSTSEQTEDDDIEEIAEGEEEQPEPGDI